MGAIISETVARLICEAGLRAGGSTSDLELPGAVNRYWPFVAAQIEAGLLDLHGRHSPHTLEEGVKAYWNWCRRCSVG